MSTSSSIQTSYSGVSDPNNYPPQNGLAVGPQYVITVESSKIEVSDLTGSLVSTDTLYDVFASLPSPERNAIFDARVVYDVTAQKYVLIANNLEGSTTSSIDIAVSKTSNPSDGWNIGYLNTQLTFDQNGQPVQPGQPGQQTQADMPFLSADGTNIYITDPQDNVAGGGFQGSAAFAISEQSIGSNDPVVATPQMTPSDVGIVRSVTGSGLTFFVAAQSSGSQTNVTLQNYSSATNSYSSIKTIALQNSDQGTAVSNYTVSQQGTGLLLDANDSRIQSLAYANGFLYGVSEVMPVGSAVPEVQWFKFDVSDPNSPFVAAQGTISGASLGPTVGTFNPSIAVDAANDVVINFSASGTNLFPSAYYVYKSAASESFSQPILYKASTDYFDRTSNFPLSSGEQAGVQRWGTYSTAVADSNNPRTFWISNEYVANGWWQTAVDQVSISTTPTTVASISVAPATGAHLHSGPVTFDVNMSNPVIVNSAGKGGAPTLQLNDGSVATYTGAVGTATNTLSFVYSVQVGDNTLDLKITGLNALPAGTTIVDASNDAADFTGINKDTGLVIDTVAPVVAASATSSTVEAKSAAGASEAFNASVSDAVDGTSDPIGFTETVSNLKKLVHSGDTFSIGAHMIVASATDQAGNIGSTSFSFTVTDTTAPAVVASAVSATVEAGSPRGAVETFTASASDAVDGTSDPIGYSETVGGVTRAVYSGDTFSLGTHTVVASATDHAGNIGMASFGFSVTDTTAPVVVASAVSPTVGANMALVAVETFTASASDAADGSSDPIVFTEELAGGKTKTVHSGDSFGVGTHTVVASATDRAGNTGSSQPFSFTVGAGPTPAASESFALAFTQASVSFSEGAVLLTAPNGVISDITGINTLTFTDGTIQEQPGSLVDNLYYDANNLDVWNAHMDPSVHYAAYGWKEGRNPDAEFSTRGYLAANPDVAAAGIDPLQHYEQFGWHEGRNPSAAFSTSGYLAANPDVAAAGIDPLQHYLAFGRSEGRAIVPVQPPGASTPASIDRFGFNLTDASVKVVDGHDLLTAPNGVVTDVTDVGTLKFSDGTIQEKPGSLVDNLFYDANNHDVWQAHIDPSIHYAEYGWHEGRNPDGLFSTRSYLAANPDVAAAGINPLQHYDTYGWHEGRDPGPAFSTNAYLAANPDVAAANIDPLKHFLQYGALEARQA